MLKTQPSIFAPVQKKWIEEALEYFNQGNKILYFYTNSSRIAPAEKLDTKFVFFKVKGENTVSAVAEFVDLSSDNPKEFRLPSSINIEGKYYYGFKNLKLLEDKISLNKIMRYPSSKILRNDAPGACLIYDSLDIEINL